MKELVAEGIINIYICSVEGVADSQQTLRELARHYLKEPNMVCGDDLSIGKDAQGKPYFEHLPTLHFSVSHSGEYWLAAFGRQPLGIDIQQHTPCRKERLSKRFFHPDEDKWLAANDYRDFFDVWAAKESYVKLTGQGIDNSFGDFSVVDDDGSLRNAIGSAELRHLDLAEGYSACLCCASVQDVALKSYDPWQKIIEAIS